VFFIVVAGREDDAFILEEEDASIERVRWELFFCDVSPEKKIKKRWISTTARGGGTNDYSAEENGLRSASLQTSAGVLSLILFLLYFH